MCRVRRKADFFAIEDQHFKQKKCICYNLVKCLECGCGAEVLEFVEIAVQSWIEGPSSSADSCFGGSHLTCHVGSLELLSARLADPAAEDWLTLRTANHSLPTSTHRTFRYLVEAKGFNGCSYLVMRPVKLTEGRWETTGYVSMCFKCVEARNAFVLALARCYEDGIKQFFWKKTS